MNEVEQMKRDDDEKIPNAGDSRQMRKLGKITMKDGTMEKVEMVFVRKRNNNGGVDVVAHVPQPLGQGKLDVVEK